MRAVQWAIVGVGTVLVSAVVVTLLIAGPRSTAPHAADSTHQGDTPGQADPVGPPTPIDAAKDTSVGTLPPPDSSPTTQMISRDLLTPSEPAQDVQAPAVRKPAQPKKARTKPPASAQLAAARAQDDRDRHDWIWEGRQPDWSDFDTWEDWAGWADRHHGDRDGDRGGQPRGEGDGGRR